MKRIALAAYAFVLLHVAAVVALLHHLRGSDVRSVWKSGITEARERPDGEGL